MYGREPEGGDEDFRYGVDLFHAEYWWEAHVYFEKIWADASDEAERELLQGLIQVCAALVKRRAGERRGEAKLREKALARLRRVEERAGGELLGLSVPDILQDVEAGRVPTLRLPA